MEVLELDEKENETLKDCDKKGKEGLTKHLEKIVAVKSKRGNGKWNGKIWTMEKSNHNIILVAWSIDLNSK